MAYVTAPLKSNVTMKRSIQNLSSKDMSKSQSEPPSFAILKVADNVVAEHPPHIDSKLKDDENPSKPWSILAVRDFEDLSQEMHRFFEGKETEQNWDKRRKAIIKISRITHGNGPVEYRAQYISFIKAQLDAILKVVDSLRTNVTTAGLNLLQQIAITLGHSVDFMVDFVAETLITRSCNTSKVKRDPAISTFEAIVSNATCNKNLLHYIMSASEHKDPNARTAVSSWLNALLTKNGRHCDQAGVLDLIEKCIKNGLNDAKPQVRTPMRTTYGLYARLWPDRAERLRTSLDLKTQKMLESNVLAEPAKSSLKRPSIRDIKAAKKREMDAQENVRPESAQAYRTSTKDIQAAKMRDVEAKVVRPPSAQSNRPSVRDAKASKKREGEAEDAIRPPTSQASRPSTKDTKTAKKRDADAGDAVRPPSAESNNTLKNQDVDSQEDSRPSSASLHTSISERRFHILSSAPMRPQRGFVDAKRVLPKSTRNLQQQTEAETPTSLHSDDHRSARQTQRKVHVSKKDNPQIDKIDVSQLEHTAAKLRPIDPAEDEMTTALQSMSASSNSGTEPARPGRSAGKVLVDVPEVALGTDKQIEKHVNAQRDGPTTFRHDKSQVERPIEIHEDETSAVQADHGKTPRVTKRKSSDKVTTSKDLGQKSSRRRSPTPPRSPNVLREIDQLNQTVEPVKRQENTRQKYISTEIAERNRSVSPHNKDPEKARKQLSRAIEKIRARSMDDYGYRRLQGLIKIHDTLFQDEQKYDELLLALLDTLETPNTEKRMPLGRQFENKFQILVTVRLMFVHNSKYCTAYYPRALSALITARRNFESRCHIVGGLEETAEDIITACVPADIIDPVLDVLALQDYDEAGYRATSMGIHILSGIVARIKGSEITDKSQEQRLTQFALKCLRNENLETRRATISFCVELRRLIEPEERYFRLVAGNDDALKSLLTYFIATSRQR